MIEVVLTAKLQLISSWLGVEFIRLFKADEKDVGADEHWFDLSTTTADWKLIKIAEFWENQGFGYLDGMGWYRRDIKFNKVE